MSGVAGGQWTQALNVPAILQDSAADQSHKLWYGSGAIKDADKPRIAQMLVTEATDTQSFITHCNYESYTCGKYIANLARLALIADQLGDATTRRALIAFMKQNLNLWFDGADPSDPDIARKTDPANPIFDRFVALVGKSVTEADYFTNVLSNPSVNPGSSTDAQGSKPDLLRQTSTPSTNTNVMWWLSSRKP